MPWPTFSDDAPLPLTEWRGDVAPPSGLDLSDAVRDFLSRPGRRARIAEVDGCVCATLIAADYAPDSSALHLERVDVVLTPSGVLLRRRPISGACSSIDPVRMAAQWRQTPAGQRDASVLFVQLVDAVVDGSSDVLSEIRTRVAQTEERMLAANPPLNRMLSELLDLSHHLGSIRDGLVPLRADLRELVELRDPVERGLLSEAGGRWLKTVEMDLVNEVPAALGVAESWISGALAQLQGERSEATNRVVLLLTIITVAFFLPTLLTGLYGMNVPLPGARQEWVFWGVVGLAASFILIAATAITRLGLWGTFRTVLPWTPRPESLEPPPHTPRKLPVE